MHCHTDLMHQMAGAPTNAFPSQQRVKCQRTHLMHHFFKILTTPTR